MATQDDFSEHDISGSDSSFFYCCRYVATLFAIAGNKESYWLDDICKTGMDFITNIFCLRADNDYNKLHPSNVEPNIYVVKSLRTVGLMNFRVSHLGGLRPLTT